VSPAAAQQKTSSRARAQARPISSFDPAVYMPKGYGKNPGGRKDFSVVRRWTPPGSPPLPPS